MSFSQLPSHMVANLMAPHRPGGLCPVARVWAAFNYRENAQHSIANANSELDVERWPLDVRR